MAYPFKKLAAMNLKKQIVLVGGGHANIQVLHSLASLNADSTTVTLISDVVKSPYSGMIPSYMAGVYTEAQLQFDLQEICKRFQFKFVHAAAQSIHADDNYIQTADGNQFKYDICSVNLGIRPAEILTDTHAGNNVIYLKPISQFINLWQKMVTADVQKIMIIGGGAGAFEVAIACRRRFSKADIVMIAGQHGLLASDSEKLKAAAKFRLRKQKINLIENSKVEKIYADQVQLSDKTKLPRQFCLVATSAQVGPIFRNSNLPTNVQGFVRIDDELRIHGYKNIFAAGDCCDFAAAALPKAGVFAVRQGPVLFNNIKAVLAGKTRLKKYKPQKDFLKIMVSGDNHAIANYKNFYLKGWLSWKLKDHIDRRFMRRFQ